MEKDLGFEGLIDEKLIEKMVEKKVSAAYDKGVEKGIKTGGANGAKKGTKELEKELENTRLRLDNVVAEVENVKVKVNDPNLRKELESIAEKSISEPIKVKKKIQFKYEVDKNIISTKRGLKADSDILPQLESAFDKASIADRNSSSKENVGNIKNFIQRYFAAKKMDKSYLITSDMTELLKELTQVNANDEGKIKELKQYYASYASYAEEEIKKRIDLFNQEKQAQIEVKNTQKVAEQQKLDELAKNNAALEEQIRLTEEATKRADELQKKLDNVNKKQQSSSVPVQPDQSTVLLGVGLDNTISKYEEIVALVREYYELSNKVQKPTLKYQDISEDQKKIYEKYKPNLIKGAHFDIDKQEKYVHHMYQMMAKGLNEGRDFPVKAMKSAITTYWGNIREMPSDDQLLSSRKRTFGNKYNEKEQYIIPKKYQELEKSVIEEIIARNKNNDAYFEEQKLIKANNQALKERLGSIRNALTSNPKNEDYNGNYRFGLSLKKDGKTDILNMTDSMSQEDMLQEICNMLGIEIPKNAEKAGQAIREVATALPEPNQKPVLSDDKSSVLSSPTQEFDDDMQRNLVYLENYKNTIKEIDALKLQPETDETKKKIEELNKLADYFVSRITVIRNENNNSVSPEMMIFGNNWNNELQKYPDDKRRELQQIAHDKYGLPKDSYNEFSGISEEISRIESKSESLRQSLTQSMQDSTKYVKSLKNSFLDLVDAQAELREPYNRESDIKAYNKDIDRALERFPQLIQFKDKFTSWEDANAFAKTDKWNDFLSTLPQAKAYLESIGYEFKEIAQVEPSHQTEVLSSTENKSLKLTEEQILDVCVALEQYQAKFSNMQYVLEKYGNDGYNKEWGERQKQELKEMQDALVSQYPIVEKLFDKLDFSKSIKVIEVSKLLDFSGFEEKITTVDQLRSRLESLRDAYEKITFNKYEEKHLYDHGEYNSEIGNYVLRDYDIGRIESDYDVDEISKKTKELYSLYTKVKSAVKNHAGYLGDRQYNQNDISDMEQGIKSLLALYVEAGGQVEDLTKSMTKPFKEEGSKITALYDEFQANNKLYEEEKIRIQESNKLLAIRYNLLRQIYAYQTDKQNRELDYKDEHEVYDRLPYVGDFADFDKKEEFQITEKILQNICQILGIEIPQAAEKAEQAIKETATVPLPEVNQTPLSSPTSEASKASAEAREIAEDIEKADKQIEESNDEVEQAEEELEQTIVESRQKSTSATKEHADEVEKASQRIINALEDERRAYSDESFKDRDVISQTGIKETYFATDENGEEHEKGMFSFVERLQDGQLQRVLVTYDEITQEWYEDVASLSTAFEKVGNEIISIDNKIKQYESVRDKTKAAHPTYDTSADDKLIRLTEKRRDDLLDTLRIYHDEEEYAYKMSVFEEKRAKNTERLNVLEKQNVNLLKAKADEKASKEVEKRNAEISKANRLLNTQEIILEHIEKTYNKAVNSDLEKSVTNQSDLIELETKKKEILTLINKLKNSPRDASNEQDYLELERMIAAYKGLANYKKRANNPTKGELGGQKLETLIAVQVNEYQKLINKAKLFGDATEINVQLLEEQLNKIATFDKATSSWVSKSTATANDYYAARDVYRVEKSSVSRIETEAKASEKANREAQKLAETKRKMRESDKQSVQSSVDKALKDQLTAWKGIQFVREQIAKTNPNDVDTLANLQVIKKEYQQQYIEAEKVLKVNESLYDKEVQRAKLELERSNTTRKISKSSNISVDDKLQGITSARSKVENIFKHVKDNDLGTVKYEEIIKEIDDIINKQGKYKEVAGETTEEIQELESATQKLVDSFKDSFSSDKENLVGKLNTKIKSITTGKTFDADTTELINQIKKDINELNEKNVDIFDINDVQATQEVSDLISKINTNISTVKIASRSPESLLPEPEEISKDIAKINKILYGGFKLPPKLKNDFKELKILYNNALDGDGNVKVTNAKLQELRNTLSKLNAEFEATGKHKSIFGSLTSRITDMNAKFLAQYFSFQDIVRYARTAFTAIRELDTALVDLKKTTSMNNQELEDFYLNSNEVAKKLGVTTKEIIEQASAWSRLGYGTAEAATAMAELSSQFVSISPDLDTDAATDGLVSIMKAFDVEVSDVKDGIMSKVNAIGNAFATSNGQIVDGLQRSSSAMAAANNSLEETIALFVSGQEILQNSETMGASLKTISMRVRGYDEETEELTETYANLSGEIANLTKTASTPGGISLFTDETKNTYKSTYSILKEIAAIWNDLEDKNQAQLLEKLFGKTRAQAGAAILSNFSQAEEALKTMEESAGSADREMAIIEESIDYKLNKLSQSWVGFTQNLLDREDIGNAVDALTALSEAIQFVIENLGLFGTIGLGGGIFAGFKAFKGDGRLKKSSLIFMLKNNNLNMPSVA